MKVYIYLLQQFLDVKNTVQSSKLVQYKLTEISSYKQLQESRDNLLQWMLFIPCDNWKTLLLYKFIVTQRFGETAILLCSLKQVFWKKSSFYIHYLHNNITMQLIPKVHNKTSFS